MTQKAKVLQLLDQHAPGSLSCVEICDKMIRCVDWQDYSRYGLMASISSILAKMIKEEIIEYSDRLGPMRGYTYQIKVVDGKKPFKLLKLFNYAK